ncbi:hypothetical protein, partial [Vibrio parahaemolyticus]|uniref:hypothetical protein n=1 Tax=Vibrio parahaemolyticus TaxID=670 RepID=UPI00116CB7CF
MQTIKSQRILERLEKLIRLGKDVLDTAALKVEETSGILTKPNRRKDDDTLYVDKYEHLRFITSSLYFMEKVIGTDNAFYRKFDSMQDGYADVAVRRQIILLEALYDELNDIWYWSALGLASAEIFSDMLEEAEHLLN